jgi:hypothetical protein
MRLRAPVALGMMAVGIATPVEAQRLSPAGTWLSQTGETRVRIAPCVRCAARSSG